MYIAVWVLINYSYNYSTFTCKKLTNNLQMGGGGGGKINANSSTISAEGNKAFPKFLVG
jgi:hypothetical protein